ncbi:MAG: hypothetical protein ACYC5O_08970 [Anaerolineae bacterium]
MATAGGLLPWRSLAVWCNGQATLTERWLESRLAEEFAGSSMDAGPLEGYAALLAVAGGASGAMLVNEAVSRWAVSAGEFHALDEPDSLRRRSFLRNSTILLAAGAVGRRDIVTEPALKRLFSYQHANGGFFSMDPGQGHGSVEAFTTAWGGRIALRYGLFDRARQAAHLLADLILMQPDPDNRYYFTYDTQSGTVVTRWRGGLPHERFLDRQEPAGETHQLGMTLAFLAEMHLAEPPAGWDRALAVALGHALRWTPTMQRLPALGSVAEGLALSAWALGKRGAEARPLLAQAVESLAEQALPSGAFAACDCGVGPSYERGFTALETTGWMALGLRGLACTLVLLDEEGR